MAYLILTMLLGIAFLGIKFTSNGTTIGWKASFRACILPIAALMHRASRAIFLLLFLHDRIACDAHDHWAGDSDDVDGDGISRLIQCRVLRAAGSERAVLALR